MKKIDQISDTEEDVDKSKNKKLKFDTKDQIVPVSDESSFTKEIDGNEEGGKKRSNHCKPETIPSESCQFPEALDQTKPNSECDIYSSPESISGERSLECVSPDVGDNYSVSSNPENLINHTSITNYDDEPYDPEDSLQSYETDYLPDNYVTEDSSSLPISEPMNCHKEENEDVTSPTCNPSSVEETLDATEEDTKQAINQVCSQTLNDEGVSHVTTSSMSYFLAEKESEVVEEIDDVRCRSRGETVLVMNRDVCSDECELAEPNICANEEVTYRDQLNSIESVDGIVFHTLSSIDKGSTSTPVFPCATSVMKCRDEHQIYNLPEKESQEIVRCPDQLSEEFDSVPKRVCSSSALDPKSSLSNVYVYDSAVQNMVFCRNSRDVEREVPPLNFGELQPYSFHRIPNSECCSGMKSSSINRIYDPSSEICSITQNSNFDDRDMKIRKIPSEEDFMRRIEKTLFESKIEPRGDDIVQSKYKSEIDLSLPLKKRLRTLSTISNFSCSSEKYRTPREDSFPSYPAKPMISIAELEFATGLLPKTTKTYQDDYK